VLQLYGVPIRSHALHLYHSVYVTMPSCPLLEALTQDQVPDSIPTLISPRQVHLGRADHVLVGHEDLVRSVAYSPDGARIASGSDDKTIRLWSAITFAELGKIEGHSDAVLSVVFAPDGTRIISGSKDHTVRIWSVNLEHIATIEGHRLPVSSVAISPDGTRIVSGSSDNTILVWCASSFAELGRLERPTSYESRLFSVAFSPNGDRIVSFCYPDVVVIDAYSYECLAELEATKHLLKPGIRLSHTASGSAVFSADGMHIVASTCEKSVLIWSAVSFQELAELKQNSDTGGLSVSLDGSLIISGSASGHIHVWNARSCSEIARLQAHEWGVVCLAFSPDGSCFVSGGRDKSLRVWATDIHENGTFPSQSQPLNTNVDRILFSHDGAQVMCRSYEEGIRPGVWLGYYRTSTLHVWRLTNWEKLCEIERASLFEFSPDGIHALVFEDTSGFLRVWDLTTSEQLPAIGNEAGGTNHITSITYSPDGLRFVCGTPGGFIQSWSASNFEKLAEFEAHSHSVSYVMFSASNTCLISHAGGYDKLIRVWNATTLERLGDITLPTSALIRCTAMSPLGTRVVAGFSDRCVRVWNMVSLQELVRLEHSSLFWPIHVALSPDGKSLLSLFGGRDEETRAWTCSEEDNGTSASSHQSLMSLNGCRISSSLDKSPYFSSSVSHRRNRGCSGHLLVDIRVAPLLDRCPAQDDMASAREAKHDICSLRETCRPRDPRHWYSYGSDFPHSQTMIRRRGGIQLVHNSFCQVVKHSQSTNGCVGIGKGTTRRALLRILAHGALRCASASASDARSASSVRQH
jgi:WD40 repeat protein